MISSSVGISREDIARHYDELDTLYRSVWGEHVHHGYFKNGRETKEEATVLLSREVARRGGISPGSAVCDVGCGYGGTARLLAEEYGASVVGATISPLQLAYAKRRHAEIPGLDFRLLNWLENDLPAASFDHVISIESSEHMPDKAKFFSEARRVLKPGGSLVVCAWLSKEKPRPWESRFLLEPICREGKIPSLGTRSEYLRFFSDNGFQSVRFKDLSRQVKRTWTLCVTGLVSHLGRNRRDARMLLRRFNTNADFAKTLFRIRLAYETGTMRYGVFSGVTSRAPQ